MSISATIRRLVDPDGGTIQDGSTMPHTALTVYGRVGTDLTDSQSLLVFRDDALLGEGAVTGTSWIYNDSGLVAGRTYKYSARTSTKDGAGPLSNVWTVIVSQTPTGALADGELDFYDAFETAWETVKLGPVEGGTANPATLGPIAIYRGQIDDPSVPHVDPPFVVYRILRDAQDTRSTYSETRDRLLELVIYDITPKAVEHAQTRLRKAINEKDAQGNFFHDYMRPTWENVLEGRVFNYTHFIDDKVKTASGLWVAREQLLFKVRWNRG